MAGYQLRSKFELGYRNKEDISQLPPEVLVIGSQNVVTNAAEQVGVRQGYVLDGAAGSQNTYGIDSAYDFASQSGTKNLRKWGPNLQVRYVNPVTSVVSWITFLSSLIPTNKVRFTGFWDFNTEKKEQCLFVNGDNNVNEWSGGVASFASATADTLTVSGALTTSQLGFYDNAANSALFKLLVNGVTYAYTGVAGQTFTGVTPTPVAAGAAGDAVIQLPTQVSGTSVSSLPTGFHFDLISTLGNQVWYGDEANNTIYASKTNNYKDVSSSDPRLPGEGILATLDAPPVGFKPQSNSALPDGNNMYIAAGENQWYGIGFQLSADLVNESITIARLKTTALQGAQSQELIADFKNTIAFISNEPILNEFGISPNFYAEPQMVNISDPIKYDMDAYNFANGEMFYWNYYLFFTVPAMGVLRLFNEEKKYWEAPQTIPISRHYLVDGQLYGHSYLTDESYQLFTGYNDNGNPINAIAAFPYVASVPKVGEPEDLKTFDHVYTEGYIGGNTVLLLTKNYDFGGFSGTYSVDINGAPSINGNPNPIIFNKITDGSLGQNTLGSQPIGSILNLGSQPAVPKFRVINTMPKHPFYESQTVYSSNDIDFQWTLLRFGDLVQPSVNMPTSITQ